MAEADALLDRWTSMVAASVERDLRPPWVRRYWRVRDGRAGFSARAGSDADAIDTAPR